VFSAAAFSAYPSSQAYVVIPIVWVMFFQLYVQIGTSASTLTSVGGKL